MDDNEAQTFTKQWLATSSYMVVVLFPDWMGYVIVLMRELYRLPFEGAWLE